MYNHANERSNFRCIVCMTIDKRHKCTCSCILWAHDDRCYRLYCMSVSWSRNGTRVLHGCMTNEKCRRPTSITFRDALGASTNQGHFDVSILAHADANTRLVCDGERRAQLVHLARVRQSQLTHMQLAHSWNTEPHSCPSSAIYCKGIDYLLKLSRHVRWDCWTILFLSREQTAQWEGEGGKKLTPQTWIREGSAVLQNMLIFVRSSNSIEINLKLC